MLIDLSSQDESTRDAALEGIDTAARADPAELVRLFGELTHTDGATDVGMSYQALALSIVIRVDAARPTNLAFADSGPFLDQIEPILAWWESRGDDYDSPWREDCGWIDSIGHGAEFVGAIGQHPTTSAAVVSRLARITARLARSDRRFVASEEDRLALTFALLVLRAPEVLGELGPDDLWETTFPTSPTEPGWASKLNLHAFLCALTSIWTFGIAVPEGGIDLPARDLESVELRWLRQALASTDTSGLWASRPTPGGA